MLFDRLVVHHLVLTPWLCGVCARPGIRPEIVVDNLRVLASVLVFMCRINDSLMPPVAGLSVQAAAGGARAAVDETNPACVSVPVPVPVEASSSKPSWMQTLVKYSPVNLRGAEYRLPDNFVVKKILAIDTVTLSAAAASSSSFTSLADIHELLYPEDHFQQQQQQQQQQFSLDWMPALAKELDDWVTNIVMLILKSKDDAGHTAQHA